MSADPFSTLEPEQERGSHVDAVAGYLASLAIFFSLISLAWHPIRLLAPAMLLALISAGMTGRGKRLPFVAVITVAVCFFLGMMITVITGRPLW
ncbi:MAG: hypothetical protein ACRDNM_03135 [Gaiellaceae bacterium]